MEYRDFVEQVKEQIQDFLPEKFADAAVEVNQIVKNNDCVLDGLMVRTEESNIAPTIYLNPYFEQIQDGAELDDVLAQIASVYQSHYIDHDIDVSAVTDFDKIKEKIVCKLINEEANKQFLQDKPYSKLEDLAVVYQILMDKTGEGTATITITDNLMDGYGITLEELHDQALQNMDTLQPHSFKGMNETVAEMIAVDIAREQNVGMDEAKEMAMQMMSDIPDTMYVLTNDTKVNGAAAILNDDIRQEIAEKVGDFYMLPSSIHETLIIPKDAGMEFKELEQMVQEVNQTQVAPGERLSDHVYEYDAKEHELFRSDRAEERAKQKEEKGDNRHERVSVKEKLAEKKDAVIKMNKLLNVMKEEEIGIAELSKISGVPERIILDIMAGVKEPELGAMCKIAEGLGICVHELRADEESYAVSVPKDTLAKLIVVSEINGVELEELINCILEKGIEEHGFYA